MININGLANVLLTVSEFDKAHKLYGRLLPEFGMAKVNDGPDFLYQVGARTAIGVRRCDPEFEGERFGQYRVGLHMHQTAALAVSLGANIVRGPEEWDWAPGYYYVLLEDPDGIRLEVNHVLGTGLCNADASFGSADDYVRKDGKDLIDSR